MYRLISLLLLIALSVTAKGQNKWYIATGVGLNTPDVDIEFSTIMMDVRAWRMLNKHWQLGISAEFGRMTATVDYAWSEYDNQDNLIDSGVFPDWGDVMSPYFAPNVFAHYQLNFAQRGYLYGGPVVGVINGLTREYFETYITSYWAGLNLGITVPLNEHVQLTASNAWRTTYAKMEGATEYRYSLDTSTGYGIAYTENTQIHSFNIKIGIIAAF